MLSEGERPAGYTTLGMRRRRRSRMTGVRPEWPLTEMEKSREKEPLDRCARKGGLPGAGMLRCPVATQGKRLREREGGEVEDIDASFGATKV